MQSSHLKTMLYKSTLGLGILCCIFHATTALTLFDSSLSYLEYSPWPTSTTTGELQFRFKTGNHSSILLYIDNHQTRKLDYLLLTLTNGKLKASLQAAGTLGPIKQSATFGSDFSDLEWHHVTVTRNYRATTVRVDDFIRTVTLDGGVTRLNLDSSVYIGGVPQSIDGVVNYQGFRYLRDFVGCIEDVEYSRPDGNYEQLPLIRRGNFTDDTCWDSCNKRCQNNGRCVNKLFTMSCDCFGSGFEGQHCKKPLGSVYFEKSLHITWLSAASQQSSTNLVIQMRFRTHASSGILLASGKQNDFVTMELYNGNAHVAINFGVGQLDLWTNGRTLHDGNWHNLQFKRIGRSVKLSIDERIYDTKTSQLAAILACEDRDLIYIGGHYNPSSVIGSEAKVSFKGCIQQAIYNTEDILQLGVFENKPAARIYGTLLKTCPVTERSVLADLRTDDIVPDFKGATTTATTTTRNNSLSNNGQQVVRHDKERLSNSTVIAITTAIILGCLALSLLVLYLVTRIRRKYNGNFNISSLKQRLDFPSQQLYGAQVVYETNSLRRPRSSNV